MDNYIKEATGCYAALIRNFNPTVFSRINKVSVKDLLLQMINRHDKSQWAEKNFFGYENMTITNKSFFTARKKFDPEAVRVMANEFIAKVYDNFDDSIKKWKDLVVLSIDGSKCVLPSTKWC